MGTVEIRRCVYAKAETSAVNRDIGRFALKFGLGEGLRNQNIRKWVVDSMGVGFV